ncbi:3-hydroxyacyl-CoA dehydrogenase family protein [Mucilaginibacter boryungensis]|uniref:3-hydroxyacyl-CoA dehydrogenase n=1 Tax=Mucilaginibacter boryungensis TaxID=768480 RepID=A0ABR9XFG7_9SPHI|nr:3-hydroxyacyl-CoA dehydrogenase NAD-binding domain-containing protein [Mucilaginibacter boryungensis]MBE9666143.1 3-hydroxyacyl-CoA dehydrogenase [Mucilaginibacter boryungensis]
MKTFIKHTDPVLLIGDGGLIASTAVCLLNASHRVTVCTENTAEFKQLVDRHILAQGKGPVAKNNLITTTELQIPAKCELVIAITHENIQAKQNLLQKLMPLVSKNVIVAINTESIDLQTLQKGFNHPERIIGLNWTEPVHTTFFLEIISSDKDTYAAEEILKVAKLFWAKDPYIVKNDGIRSRLLSAMAREAAYLVDNGYASVDDIDRACRNDAGYYLPFCGNCRYMDLMGTYAYGMVMKELNPDLSKDTKLPVFMEQILKDGGLGMQNNKGFYTYTDAEVDKWKDSMEKFSYEIQSIIEKYPFNYQKETYTD